MSTIQNFRQFATRAGLSAAYQLSKESYDVKNMLIGGYLIHSGILELQQGLFVSRLSISGRSMKIVSGLTSTVCGSFLVLISAQNIFGKFLPESEPTLDMPEQLEKTENAPKALQMAPNTTTPLKGALKRS